MVYFKIKVFFIKKTPYLHIWITESLKLCVAWGSKRYVEKLSEYQRLFPSKALLKSR